MSPPPPSSPSCRRRNKLRRRSLPKDSQMVGRRGRRAAFTLWLPSSLGKFPPDVQRQILKPGEVT